MYSKIQETIAGNINFLTEELQPYMDKFNCKSPFDLFNHKFDSVDEKIKVMGIINRRDAFVFMGNQVAYEQMSVEDEVNDSAVGEIPRIRKSEIIVNAFQREVEKQMQKALATDTFFVDFAVESINESHEKAESLVSIGFFDQAIPYLAVLWYNRFKETLAPVAEPSFDDEPPLLLA